MRILAFILLLSFLGYAHAKVLGVDNRVPMPTEWPFNAVGVITTDQGKVCSGVLVATSTVLTARHCIRGENGVQFTLGNGEVAHMTRSEMSRRSDYGGDFAFIRLNREFSFWAHLGSPATNSLAVVAGTDTILGMGLLVSGVGCVWREIDGIVRHGCSTGPGTSGAPLFMQDASGAWIVGGLNFAEASPRRVCSDVNLFGECFNAAIPIRNFSSELSEFVAH